MLSSLLRDLEINDVLAVENSIKYTYLASFVNL